MDRDHYQEQGFAVVPGVFGADEVAELAAAAVRLGEEGRRHERSLRRGNVVFRVDPDPSLGPSLRFVQWASRVDETCARWRIERRLLEVVRDLIGPDVKQIVNQMSWKPAGAAHGHAFHQDVRFRHPRSAYRDLGASYVQTMIAIDEHAVENGCVVVFPGSHRLGELPLDPEGSVLGGRDDVESLAAVGIDPASAVPIELAPGGLALWSPLLVHGSGSNRSGGDRRAYLNSYVAADACDRGEWAMRGGEPCPLGEPVLVDYEDLFTRPDPHYL